MPFGASRAGLMSVAADDIPDSVVEHLDYWWSLDEGDGTTTTDALQEETATLVGSWTQDNSYFGGFKITQNGVDDSWITDNQLTGVHDGDVAVVGRIALDSTDDISRPFILTQSSDLDRTSPSIELRIIDNERFNLRLEDNSGNAEGVDLITGQDAANQDWYYVLNMNVESSVSAELYLYDENGEFATGTASSNSIDTANSAYFGLLSGGIEGDADVYGIATEKQLDQTARDELWTETYLLN